MAENLALHYDKDSLDKAMICRLLAADDSHTAWLFDYAQKIQYECSGRSVYLRGLIELSNICRKDCLYCGIRSSNTHVDRYTVNIEEVIAAARFAYINRYASLVIQSGEQTSPQFIETIDMLIKEIKALSDNKLGITLSLGEQDEATYKRWFELGAHRYLLRIESSNPELYRKIHPDNSRHSYDTRLDKLKSLKKIGYQVGSGVMIGLPYQTLEDLADDLLFLQSIDVDMVGMGPYIEHHDTPLYTVPNCYSRKDRFNLSLKMIALLRILMPDINIAASTAMQTLDPRGWERAIKAGANVIMPNITPTDYRENYKLYEEKVCIKEKPEESKEYINGRMESIGYRLGYGEWGDSLHYSKRQKLEP